MRINEDSFYKVVFNNEAFIVYGYQVESILMSIREHERVIINDIGGNYYNAPYTKDSTLLIQELYRFKCLELKGVQE